MAIIGANKNLFSPWHTFCKSVLMFCKMSIICVTLIYYFTLNVLVYFLLRFLENINIKKLFLSEFSLIQNVKLVLHHETTIMERYYRWMSCTSKGNMITYWLANKKGNNKHFKNYEVSWFFFVFKFYVKQHQAQKT